MELTKTYRFEASHVLPKHPGKCSRLHGHSWVLHVSVEGPINADTGFVMDFGDISNVVQPLVARLDHRHLGTWDDIDTFGMDQWGAPGLPHDFYPTSENLLWWIAGQIGQQLDIFTKKRNPAPDEDNDIKLAHCWSKLPIEETCTSLATLTREEFDATR